VKLYAGGLLDFYFPGRRNRIVLELKEPTRLGEVLTGLGVPLAEVHLVVVNGQLVDLAETVVSDQDEVKIYPAVNGG
jgi:sulfur carrier protein ThiS